MEVDDGTGKMTKPVSDVLLPSLFRAKVDHPSFSAWKSLSEKTKENWDGIQVSFLQEADKNFHASHDTSSKLRLANQRSDGSNSLTKSERKAFQKA
eukprot:10111511-Ditylum_brightwellii.AAC.1